MKHLTSNLKHVMFYVLRSTFYQVLAIILLAIVLRVWNLQHNPAGFFVDEASSGLNAYSILTTGKDTHDTAFPVIFEAVGDYRDPVMVYSTIPFIWLFGLTEWSVRFASAVYGIATVFMMYLLGRQIGNKHIGLWSAFLLAILPWHVHFSRVGFQLIAAVFWVTFSLYFLHKSFDNIRYFSIAVFGLILSFFSYSTTKLYIVPLALSYIICYSKQVDKLLKSKRVWITSIVAICILAFLIYPTVQDGTFFKRWTQVKQDFTVQEIGRAYANHFSPQFLFITGDAEFHGQDVDRHSIHGFGQIYWFQLPFLIVAIFAIVLSQQYRKRYLFYLLFLILYPFGSIFTEIEPQATRSSLGMIPFTILTAVGIELVITSFESRRIKLSFQFLLAVSITVSFFTFIIALRNYPLRSAGYWGWQSGFREVMEYYSSRKGEYDALFITHRYNMGPELLKFYNIMFDCRKCSVMNNPIEINTSKKQLFAIRREDINEAEKLYPQLAFQQEEIIHLPNGTKELFIGTFSETP